MSEEILREKEEYLDNKITLEKYINSTEKEGWIDTGHYEYEFYYIIDNLKRLQLLENIIKEVREYILQHCEIIRFENENIDKVGKVDGTPLLEILDKVD